MRFFKKRVLSGLIFVFLLWLVFGLIKIFFNILKPFQNFISLFIRTKNLFLNQIISFFLLVLCIFLLGWLAKILSRKAPSKIPVLNQIFKFSKFIQNITHRLETGEIKSAYISLGDNFKLLVFTTGETVLTIEGEEVVAVSLRSTPNLTAGYTFLFPKKRINYFSEDLSNSVLKIILTGGLIK